MFKKLNLVLCLLLAAKCLYAQPVKVAIDTAFSCPYSNAFIVLKLRISNTGSTPVYILKRDAERTLGVSFYSSGSGIVIANTDFKPTEGYTERYISDSVRSNVSAYFDTLLQQNAKYPTDTIDRDVYLRISPRSTITTYTRHDIDLEGYSFNPITAIQKQAMQTSLSQNIQYYGADKTTMDVVRYRTPPSVYLKKAFLNYFE